MSMQVRISHPEDLPFSKWTAPGNTDIEGGYVKKWTTPEIKRPELISCVGSFESIVAFNSITIGIDQDNKEGFPDTFRFEISHDGQVWEPILRESGFRPYNLERLSWNFSLITARYVKFVFLAGASDNKGGTGTSFGEFRVHISGVVDLSASSELDRLWVKENIFDGRPDYGWSSSLKGKKGEESVFMDLGSINRVNEIRLLSKDDPETFFPEVFRFSYSEDNISWHHLLEESGFMAEPGTWYRWRFVPQNIRYLKMVIDEGARTREGRYISQVIEMELFANADSLEEKGAQATSVHTPYASVLRSGIVRFAMDGESREGVAVQASDRRLKEATTESPGIVELAGDGESAEGVVVQGNDRRLQYATEDLPGIVRLARDGEERSGHVVQGNDNRLRLATEKNAGIVELAEDGEIRDGVAVQGSDSRLKYATVEKAGIIKLGEDGSVKPGVAIQGNDNRLRDATTETNGIMRFALGGEVASRAAVQGDDPRLRAATTGYPGIVELARDGESASGKALQSNDSRLRQAGEDGPGIVALNPPGGSMPGMAVQGNDPRLTDPRPPLKHEHDYAPRQHDFSSHSGLIKLEGDSGKPTGGISAVPVNYAPIMGINNGQGSGLAGKGISEGLFATGGRAGVVGMSVEKGYGVFGASRSGTGGRFISEQGYSLVVGGEDEERKVRSSALGLKVHGESSFCDPVHLLSGETGESVVACYFPVEKVDVIVVGDVLVASGQPGTLKKSREPMSSSIMGVVVEHAGLILNSSFGEREGKENYTGSMTPKGHRLVALTGIVRIRARVEEGRPILPGDRLVTSFEMGVAESAGDREIPVGAVIGRSLDELREGEGLIRAVITL